MRTTLALALAFIASSLLAAEGMWMPQQVPQLAPELQKAGITIDPNRFADLTGDPMGAVVSLGGCTASFVSPDGLIVTNHHCAFGAIQYNTTPERDLITNGFLAKTREEELPAGPSQHVAVLTKIEDVTARVTGNIPAKSTDLERQRMIDRRSNDLVAECEKPGGVRCSVASFFEGSQYLRMTSLDLSEVRLVYAPANSVGDFGGEIDNFEWPRHTGDFSFLRAYVNGQPYHPAHWLKVSAAGMNDGDPVIVAGYPGRTFRYTTADEVRNYKEFEYPVSIRYYTELIKILKKAGEGNRDVQIKNASRIASLENALKNYTSVSEGFMKDRIVGSRVERERAMRAAIASDPSLAKYANVLDDIVKLNEQQRQTRERDQVLVSLIGKATYRSSPMLRQAVDIWRTAVERAKPDAERKGGYQERDWQRLREVSTRNQRVIDVGSDKAALRYFIEEAQKLTATQRIKAIDDGIAAAGSVDKFLDQLYSGTKVANADERTKMYGETAAQLAARKDAMLQFAAGLMATVDARETRDLAIEGAMSRLRPGYIEVLRKVSGGTLYPDANLTLRVTFGNVKGYSVKDATWYTPQTSLNGILQKDTGKEPFDSPQRLLDAARDPGRTAPYADPQLRTVPVNFLSTVDTTGGNSGSPTLNAKGELCGLLFDGNYESIDADFLFVESKTRGIHVDAVYMLWIMDAVDGAGNLIREMGLSPKFAK